MKYDIKTAASRLARVAAALNPPREETLKKAIHALVDSLQDALGEPGKTFAFKYQDATDTWEVQAKIFQGHNAAPTASP